MAQLNKAAYEAKYNDAGVGRFKTGQTRGIGSDDTRELVEDNADSVPFTADDSYSWPFPQVTATGTNTYAATPVPAITAYATGQKFQIKFTNASSGVSTLNLNAVGAKKIFINPTTQATTGHIVAGQISLFAYDAALDAAAGGFLMLGSATDTSGFATTAYVDSLVLGLWDDRGTFDASVNAYPSSGGSGTAGAILKGDIWTISVAGTLPTGQVVEIGDTVRALIDTPGNTQANWGILQNNLGFVPAPIASPTFTGTPAAPTAAAATNTTQIATTAFVTTAIAPYVITEVSASTAGATITLNFQVSSIDRQNVIFIGSASFTGSKTFALSNTTVAKNFFFVFEVTSFAGVAVTVPADWSLSTPDFTTGTTWTPTANGRYRMSGVFVNSLWEVFVDGPASV